MDRRLLAGLEQRLGAVPLLVDLDGDVLEAAFANLWIAEGETLVTPPLDGRFLPGTVRAALIAAAREAGIEVRAEAISLERLGAADELLLSSSVRGLYPGTLAGRTPRFELGARVRAALERRSGHGRPTPRAAARRPSGLSAVRRAAAARAAASWARASSSASGSPSRLISTSEAAATAAASASSTPASASPRIAGPACAASPAPSSATSLAASAMASGAALASASAASIRPGRSGSSRGSRRASRTGA